MHQLVYKYNFYSVKVVSDYDRILRLKTNIHFIN